MDIVLNLNKREELLRDKDFAKKLKYVRRIIRTNKISHNVRFIEINKHKSGLFYIYACFDENDNVSGILAVDPVNLIVGPSADLNTAKLYKYSSIERAENLLFTLKENIMKQQQLNNGR